jgi:hypothetical protein
VEEHDGWGHWAMGNNIQQDVDNEMEVDMTPNAAFQGLLDAIHAEKMQHNNPPPADSSSEITYSSGSSNSSSSNNASNQQLIIHAGLALEMLPINQMG